MSTPASISGNSYNSLNKKLISSNVGLVIIEGNKIYMTRQELKDYINNLSETQEKIEFLDTKTLNLFRSVANGVYQAEGHLGISFKKLNDLNFRPI
jgi:hypothetical protein